MGENEVEVVLAETLQDAALGARMDKWFSKQGLKPYKSGDKYLLKDLEGNLEDTYSEDDLIAEYQFELANSQVPKKCKE